MTLLRVDGLTKRFPVRGGVVDAVSGVSFGIAAGQTLGLVGESGCGKSTTGRAVLQLPRPDSGTVRFAGEDLTRLSRSDLASIRPRLQIIFQDPRSALNPRRRIRDIVAEGLLIAGVAKAAARDRADSALRDVGLDPDRIGDLRPRSFSGGQCQRIAIARAMVLQPQLLVCDEPVASLDVSTQAQVLNLLEDMKQRQGLSMLFISHDLAVVHHVSDRVAVMYLGRIVEQGPTARVFAAPAHPYTQALLASVPSPDPSSAVDPGPPLAGEVPSPMNPPSGCRFRTRCPYAEPRCATETPQPRPIGDDHEVACHFDLTGQNSSETANSHRGMGS